MENIAFIVYVLNKLICSLAFLGSINCFELYKSKIIIFMSQITFLLYLYLIIVYWILKNKLVKLFHLLIRDILSKWFTMLVANKLQC